MKRPKWLPDTGTIIMVGGAIALVVMVFYMVLGRN